MTPANPLLRKGGESSDNNTIGSVDARSGGVLLCRHAGLKYGMPQSA